MKFISRALILTVTVSLFAFGFTQCGAPHFNCDTPQHLAGYHGTIQYNAIDFVEQDVWTEQGSQTMDVCGIDNWRATARQSGAPATGVKTYPSSEHRYTDWSTCASQPRISSFNTLTGSYQHTGPDAGSWDATWDIWLDGSVCGKPSPEVMVLTQWRAVDFPTAQLHPTIAGTAYDLQYSTASHFFQFRQQTQTTSGTVNIKAILNYLVGQGFFTSASTIVAVKYGFEVLTTYNTDQPFWLTDFSVSDS
jgi:hypothetical protein